VTDYRSLQNIVGDKLSQTSETIRQHSYDWWPLTAKWRALGQQPYAPDAVVYAESAADVQAVLHWANEHRVAVTPWGAGSSVVGSPLPLTGGITLDLSHMNRILGLNETDLVVSAQAGVMGHHLEAFLNERGYTLNHSPQSLDRSTVGGWIATRATGQFSSRYGGIEDLIVALEVILANGSIIRTRAAPRAAIGPDSKQWFVGAEGTLGVVTEVSLKVFPQAETRVMQAIRFNELGAGVEVMQDIMRAGLRPFLVRYYDEDEARHAMKQPDFLGNVMFLGFEGVSSVAQAEYDAGLGIATEAGGEPIGDAAVHAWMGRRFDFSTVENLLAKPGGYAETIEVAHFWSGILPTYRALKSALTPLADEVLGHFSHVYPQGTSLYLILLGQAADDATAAARIEAIWKGAMETTLAQGAVVSHHHGIGLTRLPYIQRDLGDSITLLQRMKSAMDPTGVLSPGKLGLR
jgi:alkyldihydroxyacetonephosphate synthase